MACADAPRAAPPADEASADSGTDGAALAEGDPATIPLSGSCPLSDRYGGFEIDANERYASIVGAVSDGVVPLTVLSETAVEGDCRLLRRALLYCDPPCASGDTCGFDGQCQPFPENQDLGEVRVLGLAVPVSMSAVPPGNAYFESALPLPADIPDQLVALQVTGGPWGSFKLHGVGVEPLVSPTLDWMIGSEAVDLSWTPPVGLGRSRVELRLNVDQHGLSPVTLVCDFDDDGAATLPAGLVRRMLGEGVSGYPNGRLRRRTADAVALGEGCADLVVSSTLLPDVEVDAHTPCDQHSDCPPGQLCNLALQTCQ